MSDQIKGLMKEARGWHAGHSNDSQRMVWLMNKLCDALEAMAGEVATLTEKNEALAEDLARWKREVTIAVSDRDAAVAERDRLKEVLQSIHDMAGDELGDAS